VLDEIGVDIASGRNKLLLIFALISTDSAFGQANLYFICTLLAVISSSQRGNRSKEY
jgi:hypothetical protein